MALTKDDLKQIGEVVVEVTAPMFEEVYGRFDKSEKELQDFKHETHHRLSSIEQRLDTIESKLDGLDEDIRALYKLVDQLQKAKGKDKKFLKLNAEKRVLKAYQDFQAAAKELGISLPK